MVPLAGPGGKLAVFELAKSGRIPDGVIPAVINTATVMDFAWDPFKNSRLAVALDDGAINLWDVPEGGLYSQVNEPEVRIPAHAEKVNMIRFSPVAADIVATSGFDWLIKIWNLSENCKEVAVLEVRDKHVNIQMDYNLKIKHILTNLTFVAGPHRPDLQPGLVWVRQVPGLGLS